MEGRGERARVGGDCKLKEGKVGNRGGVIPLNGDRLLIFKLGNWLQY
jgi:hypothetical protein